MAVDWDARYRGGDTPWDKGRHAPPLEEYLGRKRLPGRVLVPGCGTGHDARLVARHADAVTGLDLSPTAIAAARAVPGPANLEFRVGDFLALDPDLLGVFDGIVEHTCLCALDPACRPAYVRSAAAALKPGGWLLAVLFREIEDFDGEGPPWPVSDAGIEELFGGSFEIVERRYPAATFPDRAGDLEEVVLMRKRSGI